MATFETDKEQGTPRVGKLTFQSLPGQSYQTPLYTIYTSRGCIPNLTPDNFKNAIKTDGQDSCIINLNFWDLNENPGEKVLTSYEEHLKQSKPDDLMRPLHSLLNFKNYPVIVNIRDPQFAQQTCQANDRCPYGDTEMGRRKTNPESFNKLMQQMKPELLVPLHDASVHDVVHSSIELPSTEEQRPSKKILKCLERSKKWISQTSTPNASNLLFPIVAQTHPESLKQFLDQSELKESYRGVLLGDFGIVPPNKRGTLLKACIQEVKATKLSKLPLFISGQDHPYDVLECVQQGVDVFDGVYPFKVAEFGMASIYPLQIQQNQTEMKMNLRDVKFVRDLKPILEGCGCSTCKSYTRAYIHHLLNAHEMLAEVLLTIHNVQHYMRFFEAIRNTISNGTFQEYKNTFIKNTI